MTARFCQRSLFAAFAVVVGAISAGCSGGGAGSPLTPVSLVVETAAGPIAGTTADGVRKYLGIPYAAAPVGTLRFQPPQPRAVFASTYQATAPGNVCPQLGPPASPFGLDQETSEDCLNLNVTTPAGAPQNLPVMVWIHGGAFSAGGGAEYPGDALVKAGNIVVVTINYRLGILGFLALPALDTQGNGETGGYGIEDQIAALRWVKTNIAAFGGNPSQVTIAGESAGGQSVCDLNENAASGGAAAGLFVRGIVESGPCQAPIQSLAQAEQTGTATAAGLGCPTSGAAAVACLQSSAVTIPKLLQYAQAQTSLEAYSPAAGGFDIPQQPKTAIGHMPILLGGNKQEWGLFVGIFAALGLEPIPSSQGVYDAELESPAGLYGSAAGTAVANSSQYGWNAFGGNGYQAIATTESDFAPLDPLSLCYDLVTQQKWSASGNPVYAYEFASPGAPDALPFAPFAGLVPASGPVHSTEIAYLWPGVSSPPNTNGSGPSLPASEQGLSQTMLGYWSNFVRTGNPNGGGLPNWPAFTNATSALQLSDGANGVGTGTDVDAEHSCSAFWKPLFAGSGLLD